jgi:UDP-N-acetylmuramyl pentapeptide synthase
MRSLARAAHARRGRPHQILTEVESMLSQQLAKGWDYLAQHMVLLPEPYPGCILFFTVAAENKAASVFYVRGTTLESAWREGATRVRQWAWARQRDAVELRIDWVQDITPFKPGGSASGYAATAALPARALALADAGLERAELLHRPSAAAALPLAATGTAPRTAREPADAPASLLLHLRGIFIRGADPAIPVPRSAAPAALRDQRTWVHEVPLQPALALLLQQQHRDGSWPGTTDLCDHLGMTYSLLQAQRHAGSPALAQALEHALDQLVTRLPQQGSSSLPRAMTLLVLARHFGNACTLGPAAGPGPRHDTLALMDQQAEALLSIVESASPAAGTPAHLDLAWVELAMHAYARCRPRTEEGPALRAARSALPGHWGLSASFIDAALRGRPSSPEVPGMHWIGMALAESALLDLDMGAQTAQTLEQWRNGLHSHLQSLHQRAVWPEQALYLPPPQRRQAAFLEAGSARLLSDAGETARMLVTSLAGLELLDRLSRAQQPPVQRALPAAASAALATGSQTAALAGAQAVVQSPRHLPMRWDAADLASAMQGRWLDLPLQQTLGGCAGLDASRQHHLPGAAVLVRRAGLALGVPPAALQALQASALISSSPHGLFRHGLPVLHVPDMAQGLRGLATAARQRVHAPVVAVTGCAGKTSTIGMLRQCLQQGEDARADALLAQNTALQMVNWSETAPCALVELPWHSVRADLSLVRPDILVITNIASGDIPRIGDALQDETYKDKPGNAIQELNDCLGLLDKGGSVVMEQSMASRPLLQQTAQERGLHLYTFGPQSQALVRETAFHGRNLQVLIDNRRMGIALQSDGHHMACNAQTALATLMAMGIPLNKAPVQLAAWMPPYGAGQPQLLPNGICLLDHSLSNHLLSMKAAFSQLHLHAPQEERRLVVLAGIQSPSLHLDNAQLALEPLVRAAQARRVLLYGEPMRQLAAALADLLHVNWYDDLNQLICSLLRTMHKGDTVLLAGRTTTNLTIAADAIREIPSDRHLGTISTKLGMFI